MESLAQIHIQTWRNKAADRSSTCNVIKKKKKKERKFWGSPILAGGAISILIGVQDQDGKSPE